MLETNHSKASTVKTADPLIQQEENKNSIQNQININSKARYHKNLQYKVTQSTTCQTYNSSDYKSLLSQHLNMDRKKFSFNLGKISRSGSFRKGNPFVKRTEISSKHEN